MAGRRRTARALVVLGRGTALAGAAALAGSHAPCWVASQSRSASFAVGATARAQLSGRRGILPDGSEPSRASSSSSTAAAAAVAGSAAIFGLSRRSRRLFTTSAWQKQAVVGTGPPAETGSRTARRARGGEAAGTSGEKEVPLILLSGFLGAGKTTLLKNWLEHSEGRIGVIVNDVASVNIDAKLVKQQKTSGSGRVDTIQLQNGCACCSLGDELLVSISDLLQLADEGDPFDQIVVELSGVAEPRMVRQNFESEKVRGGPLLDGVKLSKVVTVLDSSTFCKDYMQYKQMYERPDLMEKGEDGSDYQVVELLVEQTEAADIIVLNKTDLSTAEELDLTCAVVSALNEKAALVQTSYGRVPLGTVLDGGHAKEVVGVVDEHGHGHEEHGHEEHGHSHEAAHDHGHEECHDHDHDHVEAKAHSHEEHGHEEHGHVEAHSHDGHSHSAECHDPACTDPSHDHGHSHSHDHDHDCDDPNCTDPSHAHSHGSTTTAEERFGITSFLYTARRPFQGDRFAKALQAWPVPKKDSLGEFLLQPEDGGDASHPLARVVRSKGFCWLATHPSSRMYWSHAGKYMVLDYEGVWWGAIPQDQLNYLDARAKEELERAQKEEWSADFADRRQEIVFIGRKMDQAAIRELLDSCLVTDEELKIYKKKQETDAKQLRKEFMEEVAAYGS